MELRGFKVRDKITGLTGVAEQYIEMLTGTIQYSIQPEGDGKTIPQGMAMDHQIVEKISKKPVVEPIPPDPNVKVQLGDEVEDIISGHKGIAVRKIIFLNGCVYFEVLSRVTEKDKTDSHYMSVDHKRLKIMKAMKFQQDAVEAGAATPSARTGGPRMPMIRI